MAEELKKENVATTEVKQSTEPGPLRIGIGLDEKSRHIIIAFGKEVAWLALKPDEAIRLGQMLLAKGQEEMKTLEERIKRELQEADKSTEAEDDGAIEPDHSEDLEDHE